MKHIVAVDGNNIAHANHNSRILSTGTFQTQAIFGFLNSLRAITEMMRGDVQLLVLWDGKARFRFDLYPDYKGNRKPTDAEGVASRAAFEAQTPFIEAALKMLGIAQLRCSYLEADDLAAMIVRRNPGVKITLVSGDKDWIGLVRENVEWFDPIVDRRVTHATFFEKTGFLTPAAYYEGKALQGDTTDNLPGIDKMGDKTAQLFLAKWGTFERFFAECDAGTAVPTERKSKKAASPHPEQLLNSPEGRAQTRLNLKLMDLLNAPEPKPGDLIVIRQAPNLPAFRTLCERLHFASILRRWNEFMRTFGIDDRVAA